MERDKLRNSRARTKRQDFLLLIPCSFTDIPPKSKAHRVSFAGCHIMSHGLGLTLTVRFIA